MISIYVRRAPTLGPSYSYISRQLRSRQLSTLSGCSLQYRSHDQLHCKNGLGLTCHPRQSVLTQKRYISSVDEWREWRTSFLTKHFGEDVLPIQCLRTSLEYIHDTVGLPWWATICVTTVALKFVLTFPLAVMVNKNNNKLLLLNPDLQAMFMRLRQELEQYSKLTRMPEEVKIRKFAENKSRLKKAFYHKHNIHPLKGVATIITQLPLWIYLSFTIRHLCGGFLLFDKAYQDKMIQAPGMTTEGLLWFPDFTVPDTTLALPIILCLTNLLNTQVLCLHWFGFALKAKLQTTVHRIPSLMDMNEIQERPHRTPLLPEYRLHREKDWDEKTENAADMEKDLSTTEKRITRSMAEVLPEKLGKYNSKGEEIGKSLKEKIFGAPKTTNKTTDSSEKSGKFESKREKIAKAFREKIYGAPKEKDETTDSSEKQNKLAKGPTERKLAQLRKEEMEREKEKQRKRAEKKNEDG